MTPIIQVENLCKDFRAQKKAPGLAGSIKALVSPQYSTITAVHNVSFSANKGESLAFIGPNGAGKSTTIKMLTGILYPTSGTASVNGLVPWKGRTELSRQIGAVFGQKSQLWIHLPALDTFNLLAGIYNLEQKEYQAHLSELAEIFEISEYITVPVRKLSLGQRMRCEIVAALIHKPSILFLDEPTIGLDVVAKRNIRKLIQDLNRQKGVTVFLTSHDSGDIQEVCRRVIIINNGKMITDQKVDVLKRTYMTAKIVSLRLEGPIIPPKLPGVQVLKMKGPGLKIRVDTDKTAIGAVLNEIISLTRIADINISPPPLEDIITSIFMKGGEEGAGSAAGAVEVSRAGSAPGAVEVSGAGSEPGAVEVSGAGSAPNPAGRPAVTDTAGDGSDV